MTGPEHRAEAEQLLEQAAAVMSAEWGIFAGMSTHERGERRTADLAAAQVHATLADSDAREAQAVIAKIYLAATVALKGRVSSSSQWDEGYQAFAEQVLALLKEGEPADR